MDEKQVRKFIYSKFSDKIMIVLAIIAVPVIVAEFVLQPNSQWYLLVVVLDWLIWIIFMLEFALKVFLDGAAYIKNEKLDSAISIIILLSALPYIFLANFPKFQVLRVLRISRLLGRSGMIIRAAGYTAKYAVKSRRR